MPPRGLSRLPRPGLPRRVRRPLAWLLAVGFLVAAFTGIVLPLFHLGATGPPTAELAGMIPENLAAGRLTDIEVAIDNTGVSSISPVCVEARFDRPVTVDHVVFQGLDRVPFRAGRACGGRLNTEETINVRLAVRPLAPGPMRVRLAPAEGSRTIGPELRGTTRVTP